MRPLDAAAAMIEESSAVLINVCYSRVLNDGDRLPPDTVVVKWFAFCDVAQLLLAP